MVHFQFMREFVERYRRKQVINAGRAARRLQAARAGIDATVDREGAAALDAEIERLERRRQRFLQKLQGGHVVRP